VKRNIDIAAQIHEGIKPDLSETLPAPFSPEEMEVVRKLLYTRRSIRDWMDKDVPDELIKQELWQDEFEGIYELGGEAIIVMHPQLTGRPSRLKLFDHFIGIIKSHSDVELATCSQIAGFVRESLQQP
jgi:hypothetical protein